MEKYIPKTNKEKIDYLMATDDRRDQHYKNLQGDIKHLNQNVESLILVIAGTPLNGNKGLVSFLDKVEQRVKGSESDIQQNKQDIALLQDNVDTAKFWGKLTAGVVGTIAGGSFLMILKFLAEKG